MRDDPQDVLPNPLRRPQETDDLGVWPDWESSPPWPFPNAKVGGGTMSNTHGPERSLGETLARINRRLDRMSEAEREYAALKQYAASIGLKRTPGRLLAEAFIANMQRLRLRMDLRGMRLMRSEIRRAVSEEEISP